MVPDFAFAQEQSLIGLKVIKPSLDSENTAVAFQMELQEWSPPHKMMRPPYFPRFHSMCEITSDCRPVECDEVECLVADKKVFVKRLHDL